MYIILNSSGKRYAADDDRIIVYNKMIAENFDIVQGPIRFVDSMPWLLKIIPRSLLNKWTRIHVFEKNREAFYAQCMVRFFTDLIIIIESNIMIINFIQFFAVNLFFIHLTGNYNGTRSDFGS